MKDPSSKKKNGNPPWPAAIVLADRGPRGAYEEAGALLFLHETLVEKPGSGEGVRGQG